VTRIEARRAAGRATAGSLAIVVGVERQSRDAREHEQPPLPIGGCRRPIIRLSAIDQAEVDGVDAEPVRDRRISTGTADQDRRRRLEEAAHEEQQQVDEQEEDPRR
jgi:hypothetical protein